MGFHFAGFALSPSAYPANWDWYHNTFLGSGSYVSNTWRPVSAVLRVEDRSHPATRHLPATFKSSPSEWYRWEKDASAGGTLPLDSSLAATNPGVCGSRVGGVGRVGEDVACDGTGALPTA